MSDAKHRPDCCCVNCEDVRMGDRLLMPTLRRRREHTLLRWWTLLNHFDWPKELGEPEDENAKGRPRRNCWMNRIVVELGYRKLKEIRGDQ